MRDLERYPLKEIKNFDNEVKRKIFMKNHKNNNINNFSQLQVIQYLLDNPNKDVTQKELECLLNIRKSTMSGIIDTMEKKNIIKRVSSVVDGRSKVIKFTDDNIKRHKIILEKMTKINSIITSNISSEKLEIFFEVLDTMRENMEREEEKIDKII